MTWRHVVEVLELLDSAHATGEAVADYLRDQGVRDVSVKRTHASSGDVAFIKAVLPGSSGHQLGGTARTLGVIGRSGGIGARPDRIGFVSDGDGALTAIATAAAIGAMAQRGNALPGDVIVATHICTTAPIVPHDPVPFMGGVLPMEVMCELEADDDMEAVLSVDTTRANRIVNGRYFAITPTVKEGYILRISEALLEIMEHVTSELPRTLPITIQDVTPYRNGLYHINSIMQPATVTKSPVVGVGLLSRTVIAGPSTGAVDLIAVDSAVRFCIEVAKSFGAGEFDFVDDDEFMRLTNLYGSMAHLQRDVHSA